MSSRQNIHKIINIFITFVIAAGFPIDVSFAKNKSKKRETPKSFRINENDFKIENNSTNFEKLIVEAFDRMPGKTLTLTLSEAVSLALRDSVEYKISRLDYSSAKNTFELQQYQFYFPSFQTSASTIKADNRVYGFDNKQDTSSLSFNLVGEVPYTGLKYALTPLSFSQDNQELVTDTKTSTLGLSLELPLLNGFGPLTNKLNYKNKNLDLEISKESSEQSKLSTVAGVVSRYWRLYQASYQLFTQQINLNISKKHYLSIKSQISAGRLAKVELARAQLNLELAKSTRATAMSDFFNSHTEFIAELGYEMTESETILLPTPQQSEIESMGESGSKFNQVQALYEQAYESQPSLRATGFELEKSRNSARVSRLTQYPDLSLVARSAMIGESDATISEANKDALGGESRENYIGLNLSWTYPLTGNDTAYTASKIELTKKKYQYEKLKREIKAKVESGIMQIKSLKKAYEFARDASIAAQTAYLYDIEKFESGLVDQSILLESKKAWIDMRIFEVAALLSLKNSILNLDLIVGKMDSYLSGRAPASQYRSKRKRTRARTGGDSD